MIMKGKRIAYVGLLIAVMASHVGVNASTSPHDNGGTERDRFVLTIAFGGKEAESVLEVSHAIVSGMGVAVGGSVANPDTFAYAALDVHSTQTVLSLSPSFQVGYAKYQKNESDPEKKGIMAGFRLEYPVNFYAAIDAAARYVGNEWDLNHAQPVTSIGFKFKI
jgi:hypothetical protein